MNPYYKPGWHTRNSENRKMKKIGVAAWMIVLAAGSLCLAQNTQVDPIRRAVERFFSQQDRNADGKLTREEFPERVRGLFDRIDADHNGAVTQEEDIAFRLARQRNQREPAQRRPMSSPPDHADVKYGPHDRNVFDLWLAVSAKPTPLVIYYHGGGFRGGDKRTINQQLLQRLVASGVSVAAVNYRLTDTAPFPAQMHDCARALQFIRSQAQAYNLDPSRVGATGGSAGAGISQWLAFHEDLADPRAEDPVLRESTRLSCAVVYAAQTSYDPRFIQLLFNTDQVDDALLPFFGMKSAKDLADARFHPLFNEASMIDFASADDPPVLLYYPQANAPLPPNSTGKQHIHHPKFGEALKEKLDTLGVECVVKFREDCPDGPPIDAYVAFFLRHLGVRDAGS
jgi:acetyl esterase/lipase